MCPLTAFVRPMPHSGGVRHSVPVASPTACPLGRPVAHIVEQEVGYGQISWKACALLGASRRVTNLGVWQAHSPVRRRCSLPREDSGRTHITPRGTARLRVESDKIHHRWRRLGSAKPLLHTVRQGAAIAFRLGAISPRFGTSGVEIPMSPAKASADCWRIEGADAFQPNRPSVSSLVCASFTIDGFPEMPSPSASFGSALARMSAGWICSINPSPIIWGVTRGESVVEACNGPCDRFVTL